MKNEISVEDLARLKVAATDFRTALDAIAPQLGVTFRNFPVGSCGDTTPLLGRYLVDQCLGNFEFMVGSRWNPDAKTWTSHAWLQRNDVVIDITADQFPDVSEKVLVLRNSVWHSDFFGRRMGDANFRDMEQGGESSHSNAYTRILNRIALMRPSKASADDRSVFSKRPFNAWMRLLKQILRLAGRLP